MILKKQTAKVHIMTGNFTARKLDLETSEFLFISLSGDDDFLNYVHEELRAPADLHYDVLRSGGGLSIVEVRYYELDFVIKCLRAMGGEWIHSK